MADKDELEISIDKLARFLSGWTGLIESRKRLGGEPTETPSVWNDTF